MNQDPKWTDPDEREEDPLWAEALKEAFGPSEDDDPGHVISFFSEQTSPDSRVFLPEPDGDPSLLVNGFTNEARARQCGRYLLLGEIARGGMGVVLQGRDVDLGRDVALKVLKSDLADDPRMVQRFVEEAQIGGQLQHPGIVPVYELGIDREDRPFFAMKLVKGRTLAALLAERKGVRDDEGRYLSILLQVCHTLAYAHSRQVIHRDLKPANVMVGRFGEVQVVDWGFAKVLSKGGVADEVRAARALADDDVATVRSGPHGSDSQAGSVLGTPSYMPPEQASGDVTSLDERADVFALGAMLCEILTGKPPYVKQPGSAVLEQAERGSLDDARARLASADADPELVALACSCLEPDRNARPRDAGKVAAQLASHLASAESRAREASVAAAEARVLAAESKKRGRLAVALASSGLLILTLCGSAWFWFRQRRESANGDMRAALLQVAALEAQQDYDGADDALRRAELLIESGAPSGEWVDAVTRRRGELDRAAAEFFEQRERRERARALEARLRAIRAQPGSDLERGSQEYAETFGRLGIDVADLSPKDAAARIRELGPDLALDVAFALDDWAGRRRRAFAEDWVPLVLTARLVDTDALRNELRLAAVGGDLGALLVLARDLDESRQDPRSLELLSMRLHDVDETDLALEVLRAGVEAHPGDFGLNYTLALLRFDQVKSATTMAPESIEECWRHALVARALWPESPEVRYLLARIQIARGNAEAAMQAYEELAVRHPEFEATQFGVIEALIAMGQVDTAHARARQAVRSRPNDPRSMKVLALVYEAKGELVLAKQLQRAEAQLRASARRPAGEYVGAPESLAELARLRDAEPLEAGHRHRLAEAHLQRGEFEHALAACLGALDLDGNDPIAQLFLGHVRLEQGRYDDATSAYQRAVEGTDESWLAQEGLREADRLRQASKHLDECLRTGEVPDGVDERAMTLVCLHRGYAAVAARLVSARFSTFLSSRRRLPASYVLGFDELTALAIAGAGGGLDGATLDEPTKKAHRQRLLWILEQTQGERRGRGRGSESRDPRRAPVGPALIMNRFLDDVRFTGYRDGTALPGDDEKPRWSRLVERVRTSRGSREPTRP